MGDVRSANGDAADDAFLNSYCALARWKLNTTNGVARCAEASTESSGVEIFLPGMEAATPIPNCHDMLSELSGHLLEQFSNRLPPAELPSLSEYRRSIPHDCHAPRDFALEVNGVEGDASIHDGVLERDSVQGPVRRRALNRLACELLRYRIDMLPKNEEGRALICREDTERRYGSEGGVWFYEGLAVDFVADGARAQLRVGLCPPPLESVYRQLETLLIAPASVLE